VVALRTGTKDKLRPAQEFVAFPKRDQKSAIPVCADQEFFQDVIPFVIGQLQNGERSRGQARIWEPASNSWLLSTNQVRTNQNQSNMFNGVNRGISERRKITPTEHT
jgi:hypothetical protein